MAPRIVFAILDAMPYEPVSPDHTPTVWRLAREGGLAPDGGRAVLSASTYPNHATFVTGRSPAHHGILSGMCWLDGAFRPAKEIGPSTPTLFDACEAAGRRTVALFGDPALVGVCGAGAAGTHWPPSGELPEDAPRGQLGYGADRAVVAAAEALPLEAADLVVLQLDEIDTARHLFGPESDESLGQIRATDAALGEILRRFAPDWDETVVIVVSDHDHEAAKPGAIDLAAETRARGLDVAVAHDGTAAIVVGEVEEAVLLELPGVTGAARITSEARVVWGDAGQVFGRDWGLKGQHGSPRTARQLGAVGGGHPAARTLGRHIEASPPRADQWAGWILELLGIDAR